MSSKNSVAAIYETHEQAEQAVKELQEAGVDMKSLSIVGRDTHTDEHVVGYYTAGDRMVHWGEVGAFWGGFSCRDSDRFLQPVLSWVGLLLASKAQLSLEA